MNPNISVSRGLPAVQRGTFFVLFLGLCFAFGAVRADAQAATPPASGSPEATKLAPNGKINLEATARKRLPNTVADVVLGIQVEGRTADAVSSALDQRSHTLLDYLRLQGAERLRTENVAFQPQVESVRGTSDRIVGYSGSANVSFRITPDKLGSVLSGSLEHGANTVSQTQFSPLESEVEAARRDLELEGTKTALARADAIAAAAGLRVVRVEQISVVTEENEIQPFTVAKAEAPAGSRAMGGMATATGEQEVTVRVAVQVGVTKRE
jgi:uncharacterized protein YggE